MTTRVCGMVADSGRKVVKGIEIALLGFRVASVAPDKLRHLHHGMMTGKSSLMRNFASYL